MPDVAPPGWPAQVRSPHVPDWERSAGDWLLDVCPPELRSYPVLRRHLLVLSRFAVLHTEGAQEAVRRGLAGARTDLGPVVHLEIVDQAILAWQREEARLLARRREVGLVEEALRGRRFPARL